MISLGSNEDKLAALEVLLLQLYVQNFTNHTRESASDILTNWQQAAAKALANSPDASNYVSEFHAYVRSELSRIRQEHEPIRR